MHSSLSRGRFRISQALLLKIRLNTEIVSIPERSKRGVRVQIRSRRPQEDHHNPVGADQDLPIHEEQYDEIVLCILADTAKRLLGKTAGFVEKSVLGSTRWSDDITITHNVRTGATTSVYRRLNTHVQDLDYIKKWYTITMPDESEIPTHLSGRDEAERIEKGKQDFNPYVSAYLARDPLLIMTRCSQNVPDQASAKGLSKIGDVFRLQCFPVSAEAE